MVRRLGPMLTKATQRVRVSGPRIAPLYVDPASPSVRDDAEQVLGLVTGAVEQEWARGELDAAIDDLCAERRDHKLLRGMAKVVLDRTDFAASSVVDPLSFRREVFLEARALGPLARHAGPLERTCADDVLRRVAERHGIDVAQAADGLYADLQESHRVVACRVPDAEWLVHRYNLALAQSVLVQATEVRVRLSDPSPPRVRQLLRWVRFHQLLADTHRDDDTLVLSLDGPASLFRQSTRYGLQLARFLPALLLQDGAWSLEATVLWTKANHRKSFTLSPADGLVTHYADRGAYTTREQTFFQDRFAELDTPWRLDGGDEVIPLGPKRMIYPEYQLVKGRRRVPLMFAGFWRRESLEPFLDDVARYARGKLLVAVSKRLAMGKDHMDLPEWVVPYGDVLSPKKVIAAVDSLTKR